MKLKGEARITNWRIVNNRLHGIIFDHPKQRRGLAPNGIESVTTPLVAYSEEEGWAETQNTMYSLEQKATLQ